MRNGPAVPEIDPAATAGGERYAAQSVRDGGEAAGAPGAAPTWSGSNKDLVGCGLGDSRIWFTVGFGIVNEIYYPRIDLPQIRDLGFIVADGKGFWVEVKRLHRYELTLPAAGIPAPIIVHRHDRFELRLRICPDPMRDVLLIELELEGDGELRPYALLAPHLGGSGHDNRAAVIELAGRRLLSAERGGFALALAAADEQQRDGWKRGSAGYVGASDGWQDFARHGAMHWTYDGAGPGNVALLGELPRRSVLALGFAASPGSAGTLAISALLAPFEQAWRRQVTDWRSWHARYEEHLPRNLDVELRAAVAASAMVLRAHQDKIYPGAMVASLSIPWGNTRDEIGGYHLVWPRDLVECAGALLALGLVDDARDLLRYLIATQQADGHWNQNQWLGGEPYWNGIQLDETAFPVLLAAALAEQGALDGIEVADMVRAAVGFIARRGPASDQDRWEEDAGVNTFTLAVCIAALVAGSEFLDGADRDLALALADDWNARIESWTAALDTPIARRCGVHGHYLRAVPAPARTRDGGDAREHVLPIKNRLQDPALPADEQVATDFLQLVRFGLRRADAPLVRDSLRVVHALLEIATPSGRVWHRYNGDGYGEHADGSAFDGSGIGRGWPLLCGERGHYELAAGRDPLPQLKTMIATASCAGMLPEQVWYGAAVPERGLWPGRPSGSAMPLAWAHAELIKLAISRACGRILDCPPAVSRRYQGVVPRPRRSVWCQQAPVVRALTGSTLLVCMHQPSVVHWGVDGWQGTADCPTTPTGLGLHVAELATAGLEPGQRIDFTWRDSASGRWFGRDFSLIVATRFD